VEAMVAACWGKLGLIWQLVASCLCCLVKTDNSTNWLCVNEIGGYNQPTCWALNYNRMCAVEMGYNAMIDNKHIRWHSNNQYSIYRDVATDTMAYLVYYSCKQQHVWHYDSI
jgi:hypothetical protein